MRPSAILFVESLPLSANGKVDRKALAQTFLSGGGSGAALPVALQEPIAPQEPTGGLGAGRRDIERRVAALVGRILSLDRIEPDANFLDLGASSVDMVRIANLMELDLGYRPRVDALYREPTVAALARGHEEHLARLRGGTPGDGASGVRPVPAGPGVAILRDPEERATFKARRSGLRHDVATGRSSVPLRMGAGEDGRYAERRSHRHFAEAPVPLRRLDGLLSSLRQAQVAGEPRRAYPSAGGLYPVQTYLHLKPGRVDGMESG